MKMKNIKKAIVTVITAAAVAASFTGCSNQVKGTCEACGRTAPLFEFSTTASLMGYSNSSSAKLCKSCCDEAIAAVESDGWGITSYTCNPIEK